MKVTYEHYLSIPTIKGKNCILRCQKEVIGDKMKGTNLDVMNSNKGSSGYVKIWSAVDVMTKLKMGSAWMIHEQ